MIFRHLTGLRNHGRRISKGALETRRSSSTNLREINPPVYRRRVPPGKVVLTLDPSKFAEKKQRPFHIGNLRAFQPYIMLHNQSTLVIGPNIYYNRKYATIVSPSFPPDTTAFLYYFTSPERPRIAGELRLRIARGDDLASFESGTDLLKSNGQPWSRSLFRVYIPLYKKLREDGLVPDDLDAVLSTFPLVAPISQRLYTLNDAFIVDFSMKGPFFIAITEQGLEKIRLSDTFSENRTTARSPYTGSALVRFERSTLPDHKGTRTVVLRFLKIITSAKCVIPNYDGYIVPPKEGELHRKCTTNKAIDLLNPPVWSINIDKSVNLLGLQLLWDI